MLSGPTDLMFASRDAQNVGGHNSPTERQSDFMYCSGPLKFAPLFLEPDPSSLAASGWLLFAEKSQRQ